MMNSVSISYDAPPQDD